jgi:hypothetical protein
MAKVELFDAMLRHGGNKDHEIPKLGITAREITLLKAMHGEDAVLDRDIKPHKIKGEPATRDVDVKMEMFELAKKYANTADPMSGKKLVERVFGTSLVGFDKWIDEQREMEQMEHEEAMRRRQEESAEFRRKQAAEKAVA